MIGINLNPFLFLFNDYDIIFFHNSALFLSLPITTDDVFNSTISYNPII